MNFISLVLKLKSYYTGSTAGARIVLNPYKKLDKAVYQATKKNVGRQFLTYQFLPVLKKTVSIKRTMTQRKPLLVEKNGIIFMCHKMIMTYLCIIHSKQFNVLKTVYFAKICRQST